MKSKIEEKIEKAREATNEMFAAFEELNERLSAKIEPKFAEGEFVRTFDGHVFKVSYKTLNTQKTEWLYCKNPNVTYFGNYIEESKLEKWSLKDGEYYAAQKSGAPIWIGIKRGNDVYFDGQDILDYCHICSGEIGTLNIFNSILVFVRSVRPATPEEIALLDSKLAEVGKRFDKEKCELVDIEKELKSCGNCGFGSSTRGCLSLSGGARCGDWVALPKIPKHKEPIIGEMAIFWDRRKDIAIISVFETKVVGEFTFRAKSEESFRNAILFESAEQYKAFLKS